MESQFLHQHILEAIEKGEYEQASNQIEQQYTPKQKNWFSNIFSSKENEYKKGEFAYIQIKNLLSQKPLETELPDLKTDFAFELSELCRFLFLLENKAEAKDLEKPLADHLVKLFDQLTEHIKVNAQDYPVNSMKAKTWMDGAAIRLGAQEMADYFGRKGDKTNEINMCFLKAKVTTSIMSHYPELVGPDMISVASKLEKKKARENAVNFYRPVLMDFQTFLQEMEDAKEQDALKITEREEAILYSLILAVEGLTRLDGYEDSEQLAQRAQALLA